MSFAASFAQTPAQERHFDCVVFDWDGTIMDSVVAIADSIQKAARDLGLPEPDFRQASRVIGLGLRDALMQAIPEARPEQYQLISERYRHHYLARDTQLSVFPGMVELLGELRRAGLTLAIATGKSRIGLNRALQHPSLRGLFHASRCADEGLAKPDPWMLKDLSAELEIPTHRMLMIGDTVHDRELALRAGAQFVGVAYGAHPAHELGEKDCLVCVDSVALLGTALQQHLYRSPAALQASNQEDRAWTSVCSSDDLWEGGIGHRFEVAGLNETGFVIRSQQQAYAYLNRCAHVAIELDWQPGQFFDDQGEFLVCSTHGALYEPATGLCVGGPCRGRSLIAIPVREVAGQVQVNTKAFDKQKK